MTGQEVIKKNPAAERGANVVGCNWVLKIVNGNSRYSFLFLFLFFFNKISHELRIEYPQSLSGSK